MTGAAIDALAPTLGDASAEGLSVWGSQHLAAAPAAARSDDRAACHRALREARDAATRLPDPTPDFRLLSFTPANVAIHAVSAAAELRDAGDALRLSEQVDLDALPGRQRGRRAQLRLGGRVRRRRGGWTPPRHLSASSPPAVAVVVPAPPVGIATVEATPGPVPVVVTAPPLVTGPGPPPPARCNGNEREGVEDRLMDSHRAPDRRSALSGEVEAGTPGDRVQVACLDQNGQRHTNHRAARSAGGPTA